MPAEYDKSYHRAHLSKLTKTYLHNKGEYGRNADAHFKSIFVGTGLTLPITKGRISLGQWQLIYFSEFDGPRSRLLSVKVTGK